ncbi:VOC family protein [Sphingobacterium bambusae]|uniref:Bleomycin resistance protein n=1 Tax=Sphingobacterium bambusae TaxID=662858 RepID=A0ABW6BA83_9SPHI|nr:hypothetical protein [Sphingobacterium bambusae]WPL48622.1 hypothetical protein SCB77_21980 [Sphingobacterium bambusae]
MTYLSLEPFIPSGKDLEKSKQLFQELGFEIAWDAGDTVGFRHGNCNFILQHYDNQSFAENLMIAVRVDDADSFWERLDASNLAKKFGIPPIGSPITQPYGKEVNVIDIAGVCWHFIEEIE